MQIKTNIKFVLVQKPLFSPVSKSNFEIGKGALVNLDIVTEPLAEFLKVECLKDKTCLSGCVLALFGVKKTNFK